MKGKLIVIDGTDGSGKATQTKLLAERLKQGNHDVEFIDFPQYGEPSAALVEEYLNGKYGTAEQVGPYRASILYACDRYAASFKIKQWLSKGKIVLCNRYVSSNMCHQGGKIKDFDERDKFLEWLDNLEYKIFEIPYPDINILLYIPPEIGQKLVDSKEQRGYLNGKKRDIHEADIQHLKDAAEAYKYVSDKFSWITIDCAPNNNLMTREEINDLLWDKIKEVI